MSLPLGKITEKPDWNYWRKMQSAAIWECAAIACRVEPRRRLVSGFIKEPFDAFKTRNLPPASPRLSEILVSMPADDKERAKEVVTTFNEKTRLFDNLKKQVEELADIAINHVMDGNLRCSATSSNSSYQWIIRIKDFCEWCESLDVPVPKELIDNQVNRMNTHSLQCLNKDHPMYSRELAIAIEAWDAVLKSNPPRQKRGSRKQLIIDWLRKNSELKDESAIERVAIMLNPDKNGGAPSSGSS